VVGLGNPGRKYQRTRHNLGFMAVEAMARRWGATAPTDAFAGAVCEARVQDRRVVLLEPLTFMNRSGDSVGPMMRYYKIPPEQVMIVLDDLALAPGTIRLRAGGSAGGHNGLTDVIRAAGTQQIPRLRLGIGAAPPRIDGADYVLGRMSEEELALANAAIDRACQAVEDWIVLGVDRAMSKHNQQQDGREPSAE
jgi:PTH1 family peptidyl-tRNA hydrolase